MYAWHFTNFCNHIFSLIHGFITGDPLHSRVLAHSRAPLFTQPCPHCWHSRAPGEQWARLCVFTLQGCVQAARLCRGSPVFIRSRPNQIADPGPKSGPARKSESRGPENGVSRWRRPNLDIYSQNHHFGLVYDMIYQFLGMEGKNYKFGIFCQQCHPSVASGDADIRPRNASRIHTCHLFTS